MNQVLDHLEVEAKDVARSLLKELGEYLLKCDIWKRIIQVLVEQGLRAAMKLLKTVMDQIVIFMHEHRVKIVMFTKAGTKIGVRLAAVQGAKLAAKKATNVVVKQGMKSFIKAAGTGNPLSVIVVDVAQAGLELLGYKKYGKIVGSGGNVISGAVTGFAVAGPPGVVLGAAGGFIIWGIGEVVGGVVDHYF